MVLVELVSQDHHYKDMLVVQHILEMFIQVVGVVLV